MSIFLALSSAPAARALEIYGYDPGTHDRFTAGTYGTSNPVANPNFVGASYDWSGVGWDTASPSRSVALVSSKTFVCAQHYQIPAGQTLTFYNRAGQLKTYTVDRYSTLVDHVDDTGTHTTDLSLGWLREEVGSSDNIAIYPVFNIDDPSNSFWDASGFNTAAGQQIRNSLMLYGWNARVGTAMNIRSVGYQSYASDPVTTCYLAMDFYSRDYYNRRGELVQGVPGTAGGQGGDSGSPTFGIYNGRMVVMGTHSGVSTTNVNGVWTTYDAFIPRYIGEMELAMAGSGYYLDVIDQYAVPEPATMLLFGAGLGGLLISKRKKIEK